MDVKRHWKTPFRARQSRELSQLQGLTSVIAAEFDVINYSNAHHGYDQQREMIKYKGHTLANDRDATSDIRVREFLLGTLRKS